MPTISLSEMGRLRIQTISFFLVGLLLSSGLIQLLWNYLRRDVTFLPRLSYPKALGLVTLWGLLFVLVLTMISGARELMTPGAWERQGLVSHVKVEPPAPAGEVDTVRRQQLDRLGVALREYAASHDGQFPSSATVPEIPAERWLVPGTAQTRYLYNSGLKPDDTRTPLAYEPEVFGPNRLVLFTNGDIQLQSLSEILQGLPEGKP